MPKGMNCKARYPVDYDYAKGMLIMHKPWNKNDTLDKLFKNKERTINEFLRMIDNKEVPTSVQAQLLTAQKYLVVPRGEVLVKDGVNHPDIDEKQNDIEIFHKKRSISMNLSIILYLINNAIQKYIHSCGFTDFTCRDFSSSKIGFLDALEVEILVFAQWNTIFLCKLECWWTKQHLVNWFHWSKCLLHEGSH